MHPAENDIKMNSFCFKHIFKIHNFQSKIAKKCLNQMCSNIMFKNELKNLKYFCFGNHQY